MGKEAKLYVKGSVRYMTSHMKRKCSFELVKNMILDLLCEINRTELK